MLWLGAIPNVSSANDNPQIISAYAHCSPVSIPFLFRVQCCASTTLLCNTQRNSRKSFSFFLKKRIIRFFVQLHIEKGARNSRETNSSEAFKAFANIFSPFSFRGLLRNNLGLGHVHATPTCSEWQRICQLVDFYSQGKYFVSKNSFIEPSDRFRFSSDEQNKYLHNTDPKSHSNNTTRLTWMFLTVLLLHKLPARHTCKWNFLTGVFCCCDRLIMQSDEWQTRAFHVAFSFNEALGDTESLFQGNSHHYCWLLLFCYASWDHWAAGDCAYTCLSIASTARKLLNWN